MNRLQLNQGVDDHVSVLGGYAKMLGEALPRREIGEQRLDSSHGF